VAIAASLSPFRTNHSNSSTPLPPHQPPPGDRTGKAYETAQAASMRGGPTPTVASASTAAVPLPSPQARAACGRLVARHARAPATVPKAVAKAAAAAAAAAASTAAATASAAKATAARGGRHGRPPPRASHLHRHCHHVLHHADTPSAASPAPLVRRKAACRAAAASAAAVRWATTRVWSTRRGWRRRTVAVKNEPVPGPCRTVGSVGRIRQRAVPVAAATTGTPSCGCITRPPRECPERRTRRQGDQDPQECDR